MVHAGGPPTALKCNDDNDGEDDDDDDELDFCRAGIASSTEVRGREPPRRRNNDVTSPVRENGKVQSGTLDTFRAPVARPRLPEAGWLPMLEVNADCVKYSVRKRTLRIASRAALIKECANIRLSSPPPHLWGLRRAFYSAVGRRVATEGSEPDKRHRR